MNKEVFVSDILRLLDSGYTRLEKDATEPKKSLEAYYDLPASRITQIMQHPKLKGKMTNFHSFTLIDDTDEEVVSSEAITNAVISETPAESTIVANQVAETVAATNEILG